MMYDLSGRVALVTGAGQGVGAGVARALAGQGAAVAVNDLYEDRAAHVVDAIAGAGGTATVAAGDVSDRSAVDAMVTAATSSLGPVDVLVNNAGIPADGFVLRQFRDMAPEEWDRFIRLNLYGVLHCTAAVIDGMCERGWGRVVTVSSEAGRVGLDIGVSIYGAAKGGAVAFSHHLAHEVGPFGVTVNCVSLGTIVRPGVAPDERLVRRYPARRLGTPDDVAAAVVFLASPEASWVTGQTLPVNGGIHTS